MASSPTTQTAIRAKDPVVVKYVYVTPEMAKAILVGNTNNRAVKQRVVDAYAFDMAAGLWYWHTAEPIKIAEDGTLLDGQHRLLAVIQCGKPQGFYIAYNVPLNALGKLDQGVRRDAADNINLSSSRMVDGFSTPVDKDHVATLRAMFTLETNKRKLTDAEIEMRLLQHWDAVCFVTSKRSSYGKNVPAMVRGPLARAYYHTQDHNRLDQFIRVYATGISPDGFADSAAVLLNRWNSTVQLSRSSIGKRNRFDEYLRAERAIRAFLDREPLKKLYPAANELFPLTGTQGQGVH